MRLLAIPEALNNEIFSQCVSSHSFTAKVFAYRMISSNHSQLLPTQQVIILDYAYIKAFTTKSIVIYLLKLIKLQRS
jgi:hypothetical protein